MIHSRLIFSLLNHFLFVYLHQHSFTIYAKHNININDTRRTQKARNGSDKGNLARILY